MKIALILVASSCGVSMATANEDLVALGSSWRYLDDGSDQGSDWRDPSFDDALWASGDAELGYGDSDEETVVSFGPDASDKHITTYFRHEFTWGGEVPNGLRLDLRRDDGALVYLNGVELARSNMPGGPVSFETRASTAIGGSAESALHPFEVDPGLLQEGENVLAVEIHQANPTSSDISFDLALVALDGIPSIVRGPYLQMSSDRATTIRWRTDEVAACEVLVGPDVESLQKVGATTSGTEHEFRIDGLEANLTMHYAIASGGRTLAGGDADHVFTTMPPAGEASPIRVWVLGDSGTANADARRVRDAYVDRGDDADLVLMLGDNAYNDGTDLEYQAAVFDMYPEILRRTPLWSTLGNHDGHSADSGSQTGPYYDIFTLPRQGEVGGIASGTEAYYSFDIAHVHFVCLDSYDSSRVTRGPMLTWLEQDLSQTSQPWIIAFWHHPPYTKGSHDSDTEARLVDMRRYANPILEAHGVDLVLSGHSHSYERSALIDGHYLDSSTFDPETMRLDGGDGGPDDPYEKWHGLANDGTVYAVAGSSGKISGGDLNHPVMVTNLNELGSMLIEVDGDRLDAIFLNDQGEVRDAFRIEKQVCEPDVVRDGVLDNFDLVGFLQWLTVFDDRADWNADTTHDIFDAIEFLAAFDRGC